MRNNGSVINKVSIPFTVYLKQCDMWHDQDHGLKLSIAMSHDVALCLYDTSSWAMDRMMFV